MSYSAAFDTSGNDFPRFTFLLPGASFDLFAERRTNVRWAGRAEVYTRRLGATASTALVLVLHYIRGGLFANELVQVRSSYILVSEL